MPTTPLLEYFRATFPKPRGTNWGADRLSAAEAAIAEPARLVQLFDESVKMVEREYRNYQPFHPDGRTFGQKGKSGIRHGYELQSTADVAARLSERKIWKVVGSSLDFRYLDREIPLCRAKPIPEQKSGSLLEVDLLLANARDRTPILGEVKIRKDECPFYALIQLLTQAAYASSSSQRERLVLFGSQPDFVLREAVPGKPRSIDLYVLLVEPPGVSPYDELFDAAVALSRRLMVDEHVASRIGCIAWIEATERPKCSLSFEARTVVTSRLRSPRLKSSRG